MVKVLIVDDSPEIVVLLAAQLKGQGYEVLTADSGRKALEIASAARPDIILLDVVMPEMDGFEACRRLKADERLRTIHVIMVTAQDRDADVVKGLDSGADDYIAKPFNSAVLTARLRSAIRLKLSYDTVARVNEELRREIAERVQVEAALRQKSEEQRRSQKMEAVGELAGGITHEFNNLLQTIGGYAHYAMQGLSPQEQRYRDLQEVISAADRATMLTRQLLGFSHRQVLQRKNINANQLVKDFVKMADPLIGKHILLEVTLGENVGAVYADAGELQQVFMNLCMNARDAMPSGGHLLLRTVDVFIREPLEAPQGSIWPGRYVLFSVTDTGCGMSAEVQQRIFEPYFTTKEVGKGTGLGLSMVYGAVQQHNGAIRVRSERGKGATFEIYLPTVREALDEEMPCQLAIQSTT